MNRNELDQWINRLDFDIKDTKGMHSPTQNPYLINPFVDLDAEFLKLQGVLKDIIETLSDLKALSKLINNELIVGFYDDPGIMIYDDYIE